VSEYTVEEAVRIYAAWNDLEEALYDRLSAAGFDPKWGEIRIEGDKVVGLDYYDNEFSTLLEPLLTAAPDELRELKRQADVAAAEVRARRDAEMKRIHEERQLAEARALIARYDGRHPNEDIES
jgi:hypothetical protein